MILMATVLSDQYFIWWASQVVALAILVGAFLRWRPGFLRGRTIRQTLTEALDARANQIRTQLQAAELSRQEAQRIREQAAADIARAQAESQAIVERATHTSEAVQRDMLARAEEEYQRIIGQAREEIDYERRQAEAALRQRASDIVVDAAGQIVREYLEPSADRRIIDTSLDDMRNLT
jgi:F-type H+-transporting ATPase subunit b